MLDTTNTGRIAEFLTSLPTALVLLRTGQGVALARAIRADLVAAVRSGLLPAGTKVSVRHRDRGNTSSRQGEIYIRVATWPGAVYADGYIAAFFDDAEFRGVNSHQRYAPAFRAALETITAIAGRHNFFRLGAGGAIVERGYSLHVHGGAAEEAAYTGLQDEKKLHRAREAA